MTTKPRTRHDKKTWMWMEAVPTPAGQLRESRLVDHNGHIRALVKEVELRDHVQGARLWYQWTVYQEGSVSADTEATMIRAQDICVGTVVRLGFAPGFCVCLDVE